MGNVHPQFREPEVEEENSQIPHLERDLSTHRAKIRPKRTTLIDEFLDENSQLRNVFFLDDKIVIDSMKCVGNDRFYYSRSFCWTLMKNPIQAHGWGIQYSIGSKMKGDKLVLYLFTFPSS